MQNKSHYTIGTRGSDLALWQANYIKNKLANHNVFCELKIISTAGDRSQQWNTSFEKLEGKGFFTKELEDALLKKEIDIAVHSHKDLPTTMPNGLAIAAVTKRHDPSEMLLINKNAIDKKNKWQLKNKACIGTSSARRKAQIALFRPDCSLKDLRGNVPTRIQKLRENNYDAILIAAAGVERLNIDLSDFEVVKLNPTQFIPAPAQGVLALQVRVNDTLLINQLQKIHDINTANQINIERNLLQSFDGGCQLPLAVYCELNEQHVPKNLHIAYSQSSEKAIKPMVLNENLHNIESIKSKIISKSITSIFISRNLNECDELKTYCPIYNIALTAKSLINTSAIAITLTQQINWIFFSSKNGVQHFFEQIKELPSSIKIATIGTSTADALAQYGYQANFIGNTTDFNKVAQTFFLLVNNNENILFPQALKSKNTIQNSVYKKGNCIDLTVYQTQYLNESIGLHDCYIFTSPSQVISFFNTNKINTLAHVVAIGKSTYQALINHSVMPSQIKTSYYFTEYHLLAAALS